MGFSDADIDRAPGRRLTALPGRPRIGHHRRNNRREGREPCRVTRLSPSSRCCALLLYFLMGFRVGRARSRFGITAPGHPRPSRLRAACTESHANTLEWLPLFLISMWLFALYWKGSAVGDYVAAVIGLVWIAARVFYMLSYSRDAAAEGLASASRPWPPGVLLFGALGRIVYVAVTRIRLRLDGFGALRGRRRLVKRRCAGERTSRAPGGARDRQERNDHDHQDRRLHRRGVGGWPWG